MDLLSKGPDNTKSQETVKPATPSISPVAAPGSQTVRYDDVSTPSRTPVPGAQAADVRAYLDEGSKISGKLLFEGPVRIDGQVDGEISANDTVVIGETAVVTAHLKAPSVVIAGKISSDVSAAKRLEIRPTAKISGNLTTPVLVVHAGALFEGHCTMKPEAKEDRKVTPFTPKEEHVRAKPSAE
jgi:cytoskeletal protein CcmA (bactofilin family)